MGDTAPRLSDESALQPPLTIATAPAAAAATPAQPHSHVKQSVDSAAHPANDAHSADAMTSAHNNTNHNGVHQDESKTEPAALPPPPARPSNRSRQSSPSRDIIAAVRAALQTEEERDAELQAAAAAEPAAASSSSSSAAAASGVAAAQPSKSSWFDIDSIHKIEIRAFPEFFGQPPPPAPPHTHTIATPAAAAPPPSSLTLAAANHAASDRSSGTSSTSAGAGSAAAACSDTATTTVDAPLLRRRSAELSFNPFRTPQVYKDYRDFIYLTYHSDPSTYLHVATLIKFLVADFATIRRIHQRMEAWQLINVASELQKDTRPGFPRRDAPTSTAATKL